VETLEILKFAQVRIQVENSHYSMRFGHTGIKFLVVYALFLLVNQLLLTHKGMCLYKAGLLALCPNRGVFNGGGNRAFAPGGKI
jgi:hypothetical protein